MQRQVLATQPYSTFRQLIDVWRPQGAETPRPPTKPPLLRLSIQELAGRVMAGFLWWNWGEEEPAEAKADASLDDAAVDTETLPEDASHARLSINLPQDLPRRPGCYTRNKVNFRL